MSTTNKLRTSGLIGCLVGAAFLAGAVALIKSIN